MINYKYNPKTGEFVESHFWQNVRRMICWGTTLMLWLFIPAKTLIEFFN